MNPILTRYLKMTGIFIATTVSWILYNAYSMIQQEARFMELRLQVQDLPANLVSTYVSFLNVSTLQIWITAAAISLVIYYEQKRLNFGFLQALPVKNSLLFTGACVGFLYITVSFLITGAVLAIHVSVHGLYVAGLFTAKFAMCCCLYALCLFAQQIIGPPITAAAAALGGMFIPRLFLFTADKFLLAFGNESASAALGRVYGSFSQFSDITSYYRQYYGVHGEVAFTDWLTSFLILAVTAAVLFIISLGLSRKAKQFSGLFITPALMPVCKIIFILCFGCVFANFGHRFAGIDLADYPAILITAFFGLGCAVGAYLLARLLPVLESN